MTSGGSAADATPRALARRLRPLQVAVGLQGMACLGSDAVEDEGKVAAPVVFRAVTPAAEPVWRKAETIAAATPV